MKAHEEFEANAKKAVEGSSIVLPDCSKLLLFTGYYPLNVQSSVKKGAFISIDTTIHRSMSKFMPLNYATVKISISLDGQHSTSYGYDFQCSFENNTLIIPDVLELKFTRTYDEGVLVNVSGVITNSNTPISGSTRFNPVQLETFVGDYYDITTNGGQQQKTKVLSVKSETEIMFDYGSGTGKLSPVDKYTYNPAMYVMLFTGANGTKYTLMMGTAGEMGLACSIQQDNKAQIAISCLPLPL